MDEFDGLTVEADQLDAGNDPIVAYALELLAATGAESVTFAVRYAEGDQDRGGEYSDPDLVTVNRSGEVSGASPAE